jgi:hypothetical protein
MDETWVNQNHCTDYMWLPNDGSDAPKIPSGKGKRLIVLHAGTTTQERQHYSSPGDSHHPLIWPETLNRSRQSSPHFTYLHAKQSNVCLCPRVKRRYGVPKF